MVMHRHGEIVPEILERRPHFTAPHVESRLKDMLVLAKGVSPLAYQARAINNDIARVSSAVQLAKSPSLMLALLIATCAGVALPLLLLLRDPPSWQGQLVFAVLAASAICLLWIGNGLVRVLRASVPMSNSKFAAISALREYFSGAAVQAKELLIVGIDFPVSHGDLRKLGLIGLSEALSDYEVAARGTFESGEKIRKLLTKAFEDSNLSTDFPRDPTKGGVVISLESLVDNRADEILKTHSGNAEVHVGLYRRLWPTLAAFTIPSNHQRADVQARMQSIVASLHASPDLATWKAAIAKVKTASEVLVKELDRVENTR
jgi:hypothetical protein